MALKFVKIQQTYKQEWSIPKSYTKTIFAMLRLALIMDSPAGIHVLITARITKCGSAVRTKVIIS